MVSKFSILTNLLLVSAALAVQPSGLHARLARHHKTHQSQPSDHVESPNADYMSTYTANWAGAIWEDFYGGFTTVSGTLTVPTPKGSSGSSAAAWVGIDGVNCTTGAILQTGVYFTVGSDGTPQYRAWYEWAPEPSSDFSGITISAGDNIVLSVTVFSKNSGEAAIVNLSNGQSVTQQLTSDQALCLNDAEWIVEDYRANGNLVPLTNFGSMTFSNAFASNPDGILFDPSGANLVDITQNGKVLTQTSAYGSSVTINYVG